MKGLPFTVERTGGSSLVEWFVCLVVYLVLESHNSHPWDNSFRQDSYPQTCSNSGVASQFVARVEALNL